MIGGICIGLEHINQEQETASESVLNVFTAQHAATGRWQVNGLYLNEGFGGLYQLYLSALPKQI